MNGSSGSDVDLLTVVEQGSLSAAARRLKTPLTTVSRNVSELESHLRTKLFNRSNRQLVLTGAGSSYLAACKRILTDVTEAERTASGEYSAPTGELAVTTPLGLGLLKNALDQAYKEWGRKPFTAIGYGGTGASRAVEHLRQIAIALGMVSTAASVHIGGAEFMSTSPMSANRLIEDIEPSLLAATKSALDELVWWSHATMAAKAAEAS